MRGSRDNTDQGSQLTSAAFTGALAGAGIKISMDGRGRWMDNVFIERPRRDRLQHRRAGHQVAKPSQEKMRSSAGSHGGGRTWATTATLLQTAKMNDVDPHARLTQTLERFAQGRPISQIDALMPWNFNA